MLLEHALLADHLVLLGFGDKLRNLVLLTSDALVRPDELANEGVQRATVYHGRRLGLIKRVGRGYTAMPADMARATVNRVVAEATAARLGAPIAAACPPTPARVAKAARALAGVPEGVLRLSTAALLHGMLPNASVGAVHIGYPADLGELSAPRGVTLSRITRKRLAIGICEYVVHGHTLTATNPCRTLVDVLRLSHRTTPRPPVDTMVSAYLAQHGDIGKLLAAADGLGHGNDVRAALQRVAIPSLT